ncbi:MAG: preprotein translocase subunit SecG [Chthoniobacterales bacterium]
MAILINILLGIFVLVALLMILIILMQRPKSEGLGAAFGGGVTDNIFGAQTTNVLTRITGWLAGIFFTLTFILSMLYARQTVQTSGLRQQLEKGEPAAAVVPAVPAASPAPTAAVGAPGTVTNPTPGEGKPEMAPGNPLTPADQAVGITNAAPAETAPAPSMAPAASASPAP